MKALIALLLAVGSPSAQLVIPPPTPPPLPLTDESVLLLGDVGTRMTVPVTIGTRGPWPFVVDTGAERTVIARELAGVLGLASGGAVRVITMTGTSVVGTTMVPALSVSTITQSTIRAPALEARNMGALGMLGIDVLQGHKVRIDFDRKQMTLQPSVKRRSVSRGTPDEIVVTARSLYGQLIVTDAHWRNTRIAVVIDTGSPVTIGNAALRTAIGKRARAIGPISVISATGETLVADGHAVDDVTLGGIGFSDVPIAFAEVAPFHRFRLDNRPAIMMGMDMLRLFRVVQIDFANREIRFTVPRSGRAPTRFGI
ncbi:aspartyl protease family protein [Sphingomonas sp. R86521]|uniref:aspartyl protease family protein n=1 Tax=Sphingomonas sp. R86521 TaxID=3093860 RepID=UPI0036D2A169